VVVVAATASVFDHQRLGLLDEGFDAFLDKPLREARVFECLATQLGVTFDYNVELVDMEPAEALANLMGQLSRKFDPRDLRGLWRVLKQVPVAGD